VTAYNRWFNEKSIPRTRAQSRISALLEQYTGAVEVNGRDRVDDENGGTEALDIKLAYIVQQRKKHVNPLRMILSQPDLRDQFALSLTFHTNSIEGSTFSEADTSVVLFDNATVPNKTLAEHLEARNHQTALLHLFEVLVREGGVTEVFVLKLHSILMNSIRPDAGVYRSHAVRIVGTHVPTANYVRIPERMSECVDAMNAQVVNGVNAHASVHHFVKKLAKTHAQFEQIHPFSDGNGRIGRLLMVALALNSCYPPPIVRKEKRREYMQSLHRAQMHGEAQGLEEFMLDCIIEGYAVLERQYRV
jgi:Fic family protein